MTGTSHLKFEEMPELKRFGGHPVQANGKNSSWAETAVFSGVLYIVLKRSLLEAFKGLKAIPHRTPSG